MTDSKNYDISSILTEMREEYWQGLSNKEEVHDEILECISFIMGDEIYAFETTYASEVIRVPKLVRLPGHYPIIEGIFNLRGEIVAAMDIRSMLGIPISPLTGSARIIVLKGKNFTTGILTEKVLGVNALSLGLFEPVVKSVAPTAREYLRGQIRLETGMTVLLDVAKLLESPSLVINDL